MKERLLFLILSFNLLGLSLQAQPGRDSLFRIWQDPEVADSFRMEAFHKMILDYYIFRHPDSAIDMANQLLVFAEQVGNEHFMGEAYNTIAWGNGIQMNAKEAMRNNLKGIEIAERINDSIVLSKCVSDLGNAYLRIGDATMAYRTYLRAMEINKAIGNEKYYSYNVGNMGNVFFSMEDWDQAEKYYLEQYQLNEKRQDKQVLTVSATNLGAVYYNKGDTLKAITMIKKGLQIANENNFLQSISFANAFLTAHYIETGKLDSANYYLDEIQELTERHHLPNNEGALMIYTCLLLSKSGKDSEAIEYCEKAHRLAKLSGIAQSRLSSLEVLVDMYRKLRRYDKAFEYNDELISLRDSLKSDETKVIIQRQQFNNQIRLDSLKRVEEERLAQLAFEEKVNRENRKKKMAMGAGLLLLIFAGGLWSRLRYIRRAKEVIQEERDRSESLLLNILPEEIARELKDNGKADARTFEQVSILFTDFREFTQTSEQMTAQELVEEINYFFKGFDGICEKYGIEKIKTIGDSYMAAGGIPVPSEDAVRCTVLAALEMQELVEERKKHREERGQLAFEMRAGINTGHVVAGIVGVKKFQYDIWGDTVNTASRMESHGEIGQVNISQTTYEHIKDDPNFKFKSRGKILTKGKGEVSMYFVTHLSQKT